MSIFNIFFLVKGLIEMCDAPPSYEETMRRDKRGKAKKAQPKKKARKPPPKLVDSSSDCDCSSCDYSEWVFNLKIRGIFLINRKKFKFLQVGALHNEVSFNEILSETGGDNWKICIHFLFFVSCLNIFSWKFL